MQIYERKIALINADNLDEKRGNIKDIKLKIEKQCLTVKS